MKSSISVNGRQYISASRAAEITKYSRDYIGQLCRGGKIPATLVLRSWFVDLDALTDYRDTTEKNLRSKSSYISATPAAQPAASIAPAIIIDQEAIPAVISNIRTAKAAPVYSADPRPLLPALEKKTPSKIQHAPLVSRTDIPSPYVKAALKAVPSTSPARISAPAKSRTQSLALAAFFVLLGGVSFTAAAYPDQAWDMASGTLSYVEGSFEPIPVSPAPAAPAASAPSVAVAAAASASAADSVEPAGNQASVGSWWSSVAPKVVVAIRNFLGLGDEAPAQTDTFAANQPPAVATSSVVFVYRQVGGSKPSSAKPVASTPAPAPSITYVSSGGSSSALSGRMAVAENNISSLAGQVSALQQYQTNQSENITQIVGQSISNAFRGFTGGGTTVVNNTGGGGSGSVTSVDVSGGTTGISFTGGPITNSGTLTMSGTLGIANGGTALATAPSYGQLLVGDGSGNYALVATSTLGLGGSSGTVSSINASGGTTGLTFAGGPVTSSGTLTLGGTLGVANGGTGWGSVQPGTILYGNGTGALSTTSAGAAGQVLALLNGVPAWTSTTTAGSGLSYSGGAFTVNASQSISQLSNLATNGFVKTSGSNGTLVIDTNTYLTGNQNITLSGDISGSGTTAITTTYNNVVPVNKGGTNITSPTAAGILLGSYAGGSYQQLATSSLGLPTFADLAALGASAPYAFAGPGNSTSTLTQFNAGLTAYASSTIGNGTQAGGLTVNGGATTTGALAVLGAASSTFAGPIDASNVCITGTTKCLNSQTNGTVTSVNASGGTTGLSFTGGPITTSGSLTLSGTLITANGGTGLNSVGASSTVLLSNGTSLAYQKLSPGNFTSNGISQWTNDAGYLTSLAGAASSTLLADNNTFTGINKFKATSTFSGNVSVGTTSSSAALTVQNTSSNGSSLALNVLDSGGGTLLSIADNGVLTGPSATFDALTSIGGTTLSSTNNANATPLVISTGSTQNVDILQISGPTGVGRILTIPNTGNVGIGTTSPYRQLSVGNSAVFGGNVLAASFTSTSTASSTFAGGIDAARVCITGTTTCLGAGGNVGTVTSVATNNGLTGGTITGAGTIGLDLSGISANNTILTWDGSKLTATGTNSLASNFFIATSTTASQLPYASTTAITVSGTFWGANLANCSGLNKLTWANGKFGCDIDLQSTGGGTGFGSWSTSTSQVANEDVNYSNSSSDIVAIGGNSTTTAEYWFDPNADQASLAGNVAIGNNLNVGGLLTSNSLTLTNALTAANGGTGLNSVGASSTVLLSNGTTLAYQKLSPGNFTSNGISQWTNDAGYITASSIVPYPFTPSLNYAVNNNATTGIAWFQNGLNASSTSHFVYASTTALTAQSANILRLDNLASAGFVKTSANGTLSVDTSTYLTSLAGAASSTLLADNNTFTGTNVFTKPTTLASSTNNGQFLTGNLIATGTLKVSGAASSTFAGPIDASNVCITGTTKCLSSQTNGTVTSVNASGGTTGLSFTGGPITTSGSLTLSGTLITANGGTGLNSVGASSTVLLSNGTSLAYQKLSPGNFTSNGISQWTNDAGYVSYAFPFTAQSWGNSTTTALGLLGGFLSTASSTINAPLRLSTLAQGTLQVGTGGLLYSTATSTANTYSYLFPLAGNATSTLTQFNGGLTAYASSTIGNGTQAGGLTVSGGATTTGNAYIAGNVGIGVISPTQTLDVNGNINASTYVIAQGIAIGGNNGVIFNGSTNNGQVSVFNGNFLGAGFGSPFFGVLNNGNFGVGTTTPEATLAIQGNGLFSGDVSLANLVATGTLTVSSDITTGGNVAANFFVAGGGFRAPAGDEIDPAFQGGTGNHSGLFFVGSDIGFSTNSTEKLRLTSAGNVGIGTTSPYRQLSVGNSGVFGGNVTAASFTATSTASSTFAGPIDASNVCVTGTTKCLNSQTNGTVTSVATNNGLTGGTITGAGTIGLDLSAVGNAFSLPLTLNGSNQLVATATQSFSAPFFIGTSTTASRLAYASSTAITATNAYATNAIDNTLTIAGLTGSTQCLRVNASGLVSGTGADCGSGGSISTWATTTSQVPGQYINAPLNSTDIVTVGSNSTTSAPFFFDPNAQVGYVSGKLGIGTAAPSQKLDVAGSINISSGSAYKYNGVNLALGITANTDYFFAQAGNTGMSGTDNLGLGLNVLRLNTAGSSNIGLGTNALAANDSGNSNLALGVQALFNNDSGSENVALGENALENNISGANNTVVGYGAGTAVTGSNNLLLGNSVGQNLTTGSNNIAIGYNINTPAAGSANTLNIGNLIYGTGVNGSGSTLSTGSIGIGTTTPARTLSVQGGGLFSGDVAAAGLTATGTVTFSGLSSGLIKSTNGVLSVATPGTDYATPGSVLSAYPFAGAGNSTSTLTQFNGGLTAYASSTVGNGTQAGGLTVNGGATTTGNAYFAGNVGIGTTAVPAAKLQISGGDALLDSGAHVQFGTGLSGIRGLDTAGGTITLQTNGGDRLAITHLGDAVFTDENGNNLLNVKYSGLVGIGTSSPYRQLSVGNSGVFGGNVLAASFTATSTATSTFAGGIDAARVCITGTTKCLNNIGGPAASSTLLADNNTFTGFNNFTQRIGVGTTSPSANFAFDVQGNGLFSGNVSSANVTATGTLTSVNATIGTLTLTNALTIGNGGTGLNAIGASSTVLLSNGTSLAYQKLSPGNFTSNGISQWTNDSGYVTSSSITAAYPFALPGNATSTKVQFNGGLTAFASSTIGDGTQAGGLTINGGATTTGNLAVLGTGNSYFSGLVGIGTTSPYAKLAVAGPVVAQSFTATSTTSTSTFSGGFSANNGAISSDFTTGVTSISNLALGATSFESDAGVISWVDLPVTSASINGMNESYSAGLGGAPLLTVFGQSDGSGGVKNQAIGIGTTSPYRQLSVADSAVFGGNVLAGSFTATSTATSTFAGGIDAARVCITGTSVCLGATSGGTGSSFAYPFALAGNATSTLTQFNGGLTAFASSTIGNATQTGGLTINGGATTTKNAYFGSSVGIGTSTPVSKLAIADSNSWATNMGSLVISDAGSVASGLTLEAKGTGGRTYTFTSTANSASIGGGNFAIYDNNSGLYRLLLDSSGNAALGGSAVENSAGWEKVFNIEASSNAKSIITTNTLNGGIFANESSFFGAPAGFMIGSQSSSPVSFITNSLSRVTIDTSGNVGIGTTSPYRQLSVGNSAVFGGNVLAASFTATSTATSTFAGGIDAARVCITGTTKCLNNIGGPAASSTLLADNNTFTGTNKFNTGIQAFGSSTIGNATQAGGLTINGGATTTGNGYFATTLTVGANTSLPDAYKLAVTGSAGSGAELGMIINNDDDTGYALTNYSVGGGNTSYIGVGGSTLSGGSSVAGWSGRLHLESYDAQGISLIAGSGTTGNDIRFYTNGGADSDEKLRITNAGNLGIGTSSPYRQLSVGNSGVFGGNVLAASFTATSTATSTFAGGIDAARVCITGTTKCLNSIGGPAASSTLLADNNTFTGTNKFNTGIQAFGSSTIGNGTQAGGLTVNGGATTTGNAYFGGNLSTNNDVVVKSGAFNTITLSSSNGGQLISNSDLILNANSGHQVIFDVNGGTVGTIDASNFSYNSGVFNVTSAGSGYFATGLGIGTSTPRATFAVQGSGLFSGNVSVAALTATGTLTVSAVGTSTFTNGLQAATLAVSGASAGCAQFGAGGFLTSTGTACGSGGGSSFAYPFALAGNATSTLTQFNGGLTAFASSTIGNGTQAGGLTVNGGATTTGDAYFSNDVTVGNQLNTSNLSANDIFTSSGTASRLQLLSSNDPTWSGPQLSFGSFTESFDFWYASTTATSLAFGTSPDLVNLSEKFTLADTGNVGIGTTTPYRQLSVGNSAVFGGNVLAASFTATSTATSTFAGGIDAARVCITGTTTCLGATGGGGGGPAASSTLLADNNTFTGTNKFNTGIQAFGSSTIGNGTQAGGLTVSGGATTTGNLAVLGTGSSYFKGFLGIGTTTPWNSLVIGTSSGSVAIGQYPLGSSGAAIWLNGKRGAADYNLYGDITNNDFLLNRPLGGMISFSEDDGDPQLAIAPGGNVGIGTTSPYAKLSVVGQVVAESFTATSTTATSTFSGGFVANNGGISSDFSTGITSISNLNLGATNFDSDAGAVSLVDLPVTSASANNTVESYTSNIGGNPILTIFAQADGSGGIKNQAVGIGTTSPYAALSVVGASGVVADHYTATNTAATSTFFGGFQASYLNLTGGSSATNTAASGFNITSGCYAINNVCISGGGGGGGSGTVNSGTTNQLAYYTGATAVSSASFLTIDPVNGFLGIGTSSPYAALSVAGASGVVANIFTATSTTATSTFAGGLSLTNGTFQQFANGITSIENLETGTLNFETNAGWVTWADLPVTSSATVGTPEAYSASLSGNPIFTVYGEAQGSNPISKIRAVVGTSTSAVLTSTNIPYGSLLVSDGALCVDNGAGNTCASSARTRGFIYAEGSSLAGLDLAELYPTNDESLAPGDLLMLDGTVTKAVKKYDPALGKPLFGVVSSDPGVTLGGFSDDSIKKTVPVALAGRVPTKVNLEGGEIKIGDLIAPSSVPGVAKKATQSGYVIGTALEAFPNASSTDTLSVFVQTHYAYVGGELAVATSTSGSSSQASSSGSQTASSTGSFSPAGQGSSASAASSATTSPDITVFVARLDASDARIAGLESELASSTAVLASTTSDISDLRLTLASTTAILNDIATTSTATSTPAGQPTFLGRLAYAVQSLIAQTGEWAVSKITATLAVFNRVEVQTAAISNGLEMKDQITGDTYCVTIRNGSFDRALGACLPSGTTTPAVNPAPAPVVVTPPAVIATATSTDSGPTSTSTATTTVAGGQGSSGTGTTTAATSTAVVTVSTSTPPVSTGTTTVATGSSGGSGTASSTAPAGSTATSTLSAPTTPVTATSSSTPSSSSAPAVTTTTGTTPPPTTSDTAPATSPVTEPVTPPVTDPGPVSSADPGPSNP